MNWIKKLQEWIIRWFQERISGPKIKNRKVTKARFLYLYVIISSVLGLSYFVTSLFIESLPKYLALTPLYLIVGYGVIRLIVDNWRLVWRFISDTDQGRLLLYLNMYTHFEESHKLQLIKWVYLRKKEVRSETKAKIAQMIYEGKKISEIDKIKSRYKQVYCPQQLMDGHNKAFLVNALIYAHRNIQVLDKDLRDILELTDNNMLCFDLNAEMDKMKGDKHDKYMKVGKEASKRLKKQV